MDSPRGTKPGTTLLQEAPQPALVEEGGAVKCLNRLELELRFKIRTRETRRLGLREK